MLNRIPMTSLRAGSLNDIKESYSVALPVIAKHHKLCCLLAIVNVCVLTCGV